MAAPITHIVLTDKIFNKYFKNHKKRDFFVGTSFPDVRYLANLDRRKTHFKNVDIISLKNNNSFSAGLKFHNLLDTTRESFIVSRNIYSIYPEESMGVIIRAIKLLEDELFYDRVANWNDFINFFDEVLSKELSFLVSEEDVKRWHLILQDYFSSRPTRQSREKFMIESKIFKDFAREVNRYVDEMRSNEEVVQTLDDLYNNFESLTAKELK